MTTQQQQYAFLPFLYDFLAILRRSPLITAVFVATALFALFFPRILFEAFTQAYLQVVCFVAMVSFLLRFLYGATGFRIDTFIQRNLHFQLVSSGLLGALPGCGGPIMVVSLFTFGKVRFSAIIATLTATMGDAAFILLVQKPLQALWIIFLCTVTGILYGYLIEAFHGKDFLQPTLNKKGSPSPLPSSTPPQKTLPLITLTKFLSRLSLLCLFVIIPFALIQAFSFPIEPFLEKTFQLLAFIGALLAFSLGGASILSLWRPLDSPCDGNIVDGKPHRKLSSISPLSTNVSHLHFVAFWTMVIFTIFQAADTYFQIPWHMIKVTSGLFLPLLAIAIGIIPNCGPQIILTQLYVQDVLPFSSQLGNAISNDGDALIPALTFAPKASLIATLYTLIPAVIVAYAFFFLGY